MPIIEIKILEGRDAMVKRKLVKEVTDVIAANLEVPFDRVRILLHEIPSENWNVGGEPINRSISRN